MTLNKYLKFDKGGKQQNSMAIIALEIWLQFFFINTLI